jgi:hypothetical protein
MTLAPGPLAAPQLHAAGHLLLGLVCLALAAAAARLYLRAVMAWLCPTIPPAPSPASRPAGLGVNTRLPVLTRTRSASPASLADRGGADPTQTDPSRSEPSGSAATAGEDRPGRAAARLDT